MNVLQANCPGCGGPVEFKSGASVVVVCGYCRSVVARTDRALEDLGKVAEVMDTGSPLDVGLRGKYQDVPFELTGRAQLGHQLGGRWDEWYATFANGWLGWLAEAQGRFYMTFEQAYPGGTAPPFDALQPGAPVPNSPHRLVVAETGRATYLSAKGEIPYRLKPNQQYDYADLQGPNKVFGTLDYSDGATAYFLGQEVTLEELGIKVPAKPKQRAAKRVAAGALNCPNCGGGLELRAPDQTQRVTCPNCNGLLDVTKGNLKYLKSLGQPTFTPTIPLGAKGMLKDGEMTVIGALTRSVTFDQTYYWGEYLLYNPSVGFRWLVHSDNHWNYVEPVPVADVLSMDNKAAYNSQEFKIFQDTAAKVESVVGEFYWKVETGETVQAADFVAPPLMLSREISNYTNKKGGEVNWSLGTYTPVEDVEKAFNLKDLPRPSKTAPNQPFKHKYAYKYWAIFTFALLVMAVLMTVTAGSSSTALTQTVDFQPLPNADGTQSWFSEPQQFAIKGRRNLYVTATAPVENAWVAMEGDLINDATGVVQSFPLEMAYYKGVEDGESWSEGSTTASTYVSGLPEGNYTLRLEAAWEKWQQPMSITLKVEQNVTRGVNLFVALFLLALLPLAVGIWQIVFESRRWSESMFSSSGGSSSDE